MKLLILISVLSSFVSCAVAAEPVVSARVVKSGLIATRAVSGLIATQAVFVVEAGLTNTSSDPFSCAIMSCDWTSAWHVEPQSIFEVRNRPCFGNSPVELYLGAHEGTTFKFLVVCRGTNVPPEVKRMKVGFVVVPWKGVLNAFDYRFGTSFNVVWSAEFDLPPVGTQSIQDIQKWNEQWNERK